MIQREQKQWRTEHPHVSVQTVYTDGHVPFGQLILINYLNSAFYTCEKKKGKKNSYWNKHAKQPLTRRWNNRTIIYLLKTALDIHGKAKFSIKKKFSHSAVILTGKHHWIGWEFEFRDWKCQTIYSSCYSSTKTSLQRKKKYLCCVFFSQIIQQQWGNICTLKAHKSNTLHAK